VHRRITDDERGGFPRSPSDWPWTPEEASEAAWKKDRAVLRKAHDDLVDAVTDFDPSKLDEIAGEGTTTWADLFWGIVLHDTYHVGQIQMLKRLFVDGARF
jgi:hypothetical protein